MMHWTLDTLLINDPESGKDLTGEWESECDSRNSPRMKFPLKMIDDSVNSLNLDFVDPEVQKVKPKKKEKSKNQVTVVTLSSKNKKDKNKKLF